MKIAIVSEPENTSNYEIPTSPLKSNKPSSCFFLRSQKLWFYIPAICFAVIFFFQVQSTEITSPSSSWILQWRDMFTNSTLNDCASKLSSSVTFLPLKDLRYSSEPMKGRTWFMSSLDDAKDDLQYQQFPTKASGNRVLCVRGNNSHDGSWNSYALAWPDALPQNSTLLNGTTFVSNNHFGYDNIWHGLSATMPFVAWHIENKCVIPKRWILYHWGEFRSSMAPWIQTLLEATFGEQINIEKLNGVTQLLVDDNQDDRSNPSCFEEAVVMRHNEGRMSIDKRMESYDLMRCKARMYCNVTSGKMDENGVPKIGMTMWMRDGARSFRNSSMVISIFEKECQRVEGCRLTVAHSNNLTFCQQVELMSKTDIMVSPHGAQLTNMIFMDRNSSVMEFFPKGWLKLAGVGQFIYHWMADWSGMKHQGAWRDSEGDSCPYPEDDHRCFSTVFKNGRIGHNETYFSEWARRVLDFQVNIEKSQLQSQDSMRNMKIVSPVTGLCGCI